MTDRLTDDLLVCVLAHPATWAEPSPGLEDAVAEAVMRAQAQSPAPLHAVENLPEVEPSVAPRRAGRTRPRKLALLAAAAVFATCAVGVGVRVTGHEDQPEFSSTLTATASNPGAHGAVEMYRSDAGFRVSLDASGLPVLPAGEYYQAWLADTSGTYVALGTFSSGEGEVTLWSGVSATEFPRVCVTIEVSDRAPAPSARRVLVGVMQPA